MSMVLVSQTGVNLHKIFLIHPCLYGNTWQWKDRISLQPFFANDVTFSYNIKNLLRLSDGLNTNRNMAKCRDIQHLDYSRWLWMGYNNFYKYQIHKRENFTKIGTLSKFRTKKHSKIYCFGVGNCCKCRRWIIETLSKN